MAFNILLRFLLAANGPDSLLAKAVGNDWKGNISLAIYVLALGLNFIYPLLSIACYVTVAVIWFIPDKRIERVLHNKR